jgi:phosphopantothenoylcysteine decarboxylase/phosphopantothenate--cysteine ligase
VADWRVAATAAQKIKKDGAPPRLELVPNPDILAALAEAGNARPALVIGFAAETERVVEQAKIKRQAKRCDWIVANDVSPASGTFGGRDNRVHVIDESGVENWPLLSKRDVAERLAERIAAHFAAAS